MLWLGERHGNLSDYITQLWVRLTGRRVDLATQPWLAGPVGSTRGIGTDFFRILAREEGLLVTEGRGLLPDFDLVCPGTAPGVRHFYENTAEYDLEAWSEWCSFFRPFGQLLALLFSRRLQQLNVPLSSLDTSRGVTSSVVNLVDPTNSQIRYTGWLRELRGTRQVLYAGSYSTCSVPHYEGSCIKVVFPLPNGNAIVIMYPQIHSDGSFSVTSAGDGFGGSGFYFTVHHDGKAWARYVKAMRETITVYESDMNEVRADHVLRFGGLTFLKLHYRLRKKQKGGLSSAPSVAG
jgi:hypothetical protein